MDPNSFFHASASTASSSRPVQHEHHLEPSYDFFQPDHQPLPLYEPHTPRATGHVATTGAMYAAAQQPAHANVHHHHQGLTCAPIPPARTSSLQVPASPHHHVPSLQVIHPTPIKKKLRRSAVTGSMSSDVGGSPTVRPRSPQNTLDVSVEHDTTSGMPGNEEAQHISKEEERKARAREKGRERQRRKRERDKKAREEAKTSSKHLPLPARNPSSNNLAALTSSLPLNVSPSVPSSTSSTYSALPLSTSHYSLSPGQSYGLSAASTSVSGQSSPNLLFSPTISTPGISYGDMTWAEGGMSNLDISTLRQKSKTHIKNRASLTSVTGFRPLSQEMPSLAGLSFTVKRPEKRRKSDQDDPSGQVGLGMNLGDMMNQSWAQLDNDARPKPRRAASDGVVLGFGGEWRGRSPTPPPVPHIAVEFRKPCPATPSSGGAFFASSVLLALGSDANAQLTATLKSQLHIGKEELESMQNDLAMMYDRWKIERGMSAVSLGVGKATHTTQSEHQSPIASPPIKTKPLESFVTPSVSRTRARQPITLDSPLTQATQAHQRTRSLSSASLLNRGLVINTSQPAPTRWESPGAPKGSDSPVQSSLQTPSTAQGSFAIAHGDPASQAQLRSFTDPSQLRYSHTDSGSHPSTQMKAGGAEQSALDSPLAMTNKAASMAPPSLQLDQPQHLPQLVAQPDFSMATPFTPATRMAIRQSVPFTPPTPMLLKGGAEAPMWYNPSFAHAGHMAQVQLTPHQHTARPQDTLHSTPDVHQQTVFGFASYDNFAQ